MDPRSDASSRERLLFYMKTRGPQNTAWLAKRLDLTPMAVRQHLQRLEEAELVAFDEERAGVGRPSRVWRLTEKGHGRFPEAYADLSLELIAAVRETFGADGLQRLVDQRTQMQREKYAGDLPRRGGSLEQRVSALTRARHDEGYMAEWTRAEDGSFLLIENHCPVCAAAQVCQGICAGELELFQAVLAPARVQREEHMLDGSRRCVYRIAPA